jgi:hypothetical protein
MDTTNVLAQVYINKVFCGYFKKNSNLYAEEKTDIKKDGAPPI